MPIRFEKLTIFVAAFIVAISGNLSARENKIIQQQSITESGNANYDTISTGIVALALGMDGRFGLAGDAGHTGIRMDYFDFPAECDKTEEIPGDTRYYLYDGSVVIGRIVDGDTIVSNMIYGADLASPNRFIALSTATGPINEDVFQYWESGTIVNADSSIALKLSYYAPQRTVTYDFPPNDKWYSDEQFITRELKIWSYDSQTHQNILVGEVVDWDIPSDSGARNSGEVDEARNLLYCVGGEFDQDDLLECQDNNLRFGGMAFGYFKRYVANQDSMAWFIVDSIPYGGYHEANSRFVYQGWNDNELYYNMSWNTGLNPWVAAHTDSQLTDLHSVLTFVQSFDLHPDDTLVFYSVLTTVRNANDETPKSTSERIKELADKGRNFTRYFGCCHELRGDLNSDGIDGNLVDLTFIVNRIFRNGPNAMCAGEADVNADGSPGDILDLSYLVDRIFRGGPPPYSCGEAPCNTSNCHDE